MTSQPTSVHSFKPVCDYFLHRNKKSMNGLLPLVSTFFSQHVSTFVAESDRQLSFLEDSLKPINLFSLYRCTDVDSLHFLV